MLPFSLSTPCIIFTSLFQSDSNSFPVASVPHKTVLTADFLCGLQLRKMTPLFSPLCLSRIQVNSNWAECEKKSVFSWSKILLKEVNDKESLVQRKSPCCLLTWVMKVHLFVESHLMYMLRTHLGTLLSGVLHFLSALSRLVYPCLVNEKIKAQRL